MPDSLEGSLPARRIKSRRPAIGSARVMHLGRRAMRIGHHLLRENLACDQNEIGLIFDPGRAWIRKAYELAAP